MVKEPQRSGEFVARERTEGGVCANIARSFVVDVSPAQALTEFAPVLISR
jgi:hypothetical protein